MKTPLLVALATAVSGCTGQTAAVLVDHEGPDGQAEASVDGPSPELDAAQERADGGSADVWTEPDADAGGDELLEASADVVDEQALEDQASDAPGAGDAVPVDAGDGEASVTCPSTCMMTTETDVSGQCDTGSGCLPAPNSTMACLPAGVQVPYCGGPIQTYPCCVVATGGCRFFWCPPNQ